MLERGSVEGEVFHRGAVQALALEETPVTPRLAALVRRQLIRPDRAQLPGDDAYRFSHLLIRDAAYDALPKSTRAELHERFARWLEDRGASLVERDEIVGYHLEQAIRCRRELGLPVDATLAAAASERLTAAGVRAVARGDYEAANLLGRALALAPADEIHLALELDRADALFRASRLDEALETTSSLVSRAAAAGDRIAELSAKLKEGALRLEFEPEGVAEPLARLVEEALPEFEAAGDDYALFVAYMALGQLKNQQGQMDDEADAYERAALHAQRAGRPYEFLSVQAQGRAEGTTPVSELLAWLDEREGRPTFDWALERRRAQALARLGRLDEARSILGAVRARAVERGGLYLFRMLNSSMAVELLAGDPAAAAAFGRETMKLFDEGVGGRGGASGVAGDLARACYELGLLDEAEHWADRAADLGASDDVGTQMIWRQAKAKVLAQRGQHATAGQLAREAVAIAETTDFLDSQGDAYADLGEVLALAGRAGAAADALAEALARYERKENLVMAARTRRRLDQLEQDRADLVSPPGS